MSGYGEKRNYNDNRVGGNQTNRVVTGISGQFCGDCGKYQSQGRFDKSDQTWYCQNCWDSYEDNNTQAQYPKKNYNNNYNRRSRNNRNNQQSNDAEIAEKVGLMKVELVEAEKKFTSLKEKYDSFQSEFSKIQKEFETAAQHLTQTKRDLETLQNSLSE
eukprot:c22029_g4_i1.p1 GENE.c22029_g4_i1~~c22029_g4_i1.p1  ORF type:complete len:183 (+),score=48.84 c22029_g4_i1:73-549(+)